MKTTGTRKQVNKMHKKPKEQKTNLKEIVKKWLEMDPRNIPTPKNNQEKIIQGLISNAKNGDTKAFQTLNEITGEMEEIKNHPQVELVCEVVDNTRLEKFLYMKPEDMAKWEKEHEGMNEYKITCVNERAKAKLDEEFPDENKINVE